MHANGRSPCSRHTAWDFRTRAQVEAHVHSGAGESCVRMRKLVRVRVGRGHLDAVFRFDAHEGTRARVRANLTAAGAGYDRTRGERGSGLHAGSGRRISASPRGKATLVGSAPFVTVHSCLQRRGPKVFRRLPRVVIIVVAFPSNEVFYTFVAVRARPAI